MVTDAKMVNMLADGDESPVHVIRHGIRGTQNVNKTDKEVSNIQQTDSAKLDSDAVGMMVRFSYRPFPMNHDMQFHAAPDKGDTVENVKAFKDSVTNFMERAKESDSLKDVSNRIARNILNGRWLWRNRTLAENVIVRVRVGQSESAVVEVSALDIPMNHFDDLSADEMKLGELVAQNLSGVDNHTFNVEAEINFGMEGAIEVFPSQNYLENTPKGFSRSLYYSNPNKGFNKTGIDIMGDAAIRDQKISNALRTVDTWYPDYESWGKPIAAEPNGANLEAQEFFRPYAKKYSAFKIMGNLNVIDIESDDAKFMIACMIRGGVFPSSKK
jgi:CRISPR-associated protein Csy3